MLDEFIRYLESERRYSPLTVRNYRRDIEAFMEWLGADDATFDPRRIAAEDIREWIVHLSDQGRLCAASINREVSSVRSLFRWLLRTGAVERDGARVDVTASKSSAEEGGSFGIIAGYENRKTDVLHAAGYSFPYTFELSWIVLKSFGMLFTGGVPITDVTGPVGTVATIATFSQTDFRYFLWAN